MDNENLIINKIEELEKFGYIVLRSYLSYPEKLKNKLDDIYHDNYIENNKKFKMAPLGYQGTINADQIINCLPFYGLDFINLATSGLIIDILKYFLNDIHYGLIPEDDANFILAQMNARNERIPLPWHVDTRLMIDGNKPFSMQAFIALEDINDHNGALCVKPKSHLSKSLPKINNFNYSDEDIIELKAGDAIIFDSRLWHCTRSKCLEPSAWTILLTYRCWWIKQQFDLFDISSKFHNEISNNQKLILGGCSIPSKDIYSTSSMRRGYDFFGDLK